MSLIQVKHVLAVVRGINVCHRDIHGARNILNKYIYEKIYTKGLEIEEVKYITYLRPLKNKKADQVS